MKRSQLVFAGLTLGVVAIFIGATTVHAEPAAAGIELGGKDGGKVIELGAKDGGKVIELGGKDGGKVADDLELGGKDGGKVAGHKDGGK